jgi:hypothetical protein
MEIRLQAAAKASELVVVAQEVRPSAFAWMDYPCSHAELDHREVYEDYPFSHAVKGSSGD